MIAMALACEPKLLIADEPTTALDVTIQAQILDLIDDLRQRLRMAVVLITHDMGVIAGRTDRVLVMYAGKIVEEAPTLEMFTAMRHRYSEALLASVPKLDQDASVPLRSIAGLPPDLSQPIGPLPVRPTVPVRPGQVLGGSNPSSSAPSAATPPTWPPASTPSARARSTPRPPRRPRSRPETSSSAPRSARTGRSSPTSGPGPQRLEGQPVLLQVEHLVKEFPVTSGALLQRKVGQREGRLRRLVHHPHGRDLRPGGGVGLRQDHDRTPRRRARAGRLRTILFDGDDIRTLRGKPTCATSRRDLQLMFQDPYASLDPRMRVGTILREPFVVQGIGHSAERRREGAGAPERGRPQPATRATSTPTSSPAASASASDWPGPSPSSPA